MTRKVPAAEAEAEIEIKKSRFIARAARAESREQAMAVIEQARADYPDARHHCWAYLIGDPDATVNAASNDDGEPGGTAGKPIFNVIQHKGIGDIVVVVIRYFGGIKLGAGGLVRAYSGATEAVLSQLPLTERQPHARRCLRLDFAKEQLLRHWAQEHNAEVLGVDYGQAVVMKLDVPEPALAELAAFCQAQGVEVWE